MIIDPRQGYATAERFPNTELVLEWPDTALTRLKPNARTAIVTLSHDVKLDDPALQTSLASSAFYIGALGSRRNHAKRLERLTDQGFTEKSLARIQAPVGLNLGGNSPGEIALSVMAAITAARYDKSF
jgi:xanthine dehydrogenase accessory factor